jgi:polyisoprenoid-binding protein YceI
MLSIAVVTVLGVLAPRAPSEPASDIASGPWQIDSRDSYAQIVTDGTTNFGKKKIDITLGFARLNGGLQLDDKDPGQSRLDLRIYPASAMAPPIGEDGKVRAQWFENLANHTLVCFHSTSVVRTPDGKLKAAGKLTLTRVDRNVDSAPGEAYAGPVYGPPIVHHVSQDATFILDISIQAAQGGKVSGIYASTSTKVYREDFPQMIRAIVSTAWPPLIQEKNCEAPAPSEAYGGQKCTGTFLETPALPVSAYARAGEDYPGPTDFNAVAGERVTLQIQMHLKAQGAGERAAGSN